MGWGWLFGKKKKNSKSGSKALAERTYLQDDVSSRNLQDDASSRKYPGNESVENSGLNIIAVEEPDDSMNRSFDENDPANFIIDTSSKPKDKEEPAPEEQEKKIPQPAPQPQPAHQQEPPAKQEPVVQDDDVILNGSTVYWGDTKAHAGRHRLAGRSAKKQDKIVEEEKASGKGKKAPVVIIEGLDEIDDGQREVNPYGFEPERPRPRSKVGIVQKAGNRAAAMVNGVLQSAVMAVTSPVLSVYSSVTEKGASDAKAQTQEERRHDLIPGWNGAVFENTDASGREILADWRRVPTVWSRPTPGKAENADHSQLPPEISVYAEQPKLGSSRSVYGKNAGHVFLGIRYSRFNRRSAKNERYELIYGFYPQEGYSELAPTGAMSAKGVRIPGMLKDDFTSPYTISRRYPATNAQVNAIIKASETYADKGYSMFHRNCTTFARDMLQTAHLNTGGKIFEEEEIRFSGAVNAVRAIGNAAGPYYDTKTLKQVAQGTKEEDTSYAGYGNMRSTGRDIRQYKTSRNYFNPIKRGYTPAVAGENLRRIHGDGNGVRGSFQYAGNMAESAEKIITIGMSELEKELADAALPAGQTAESLLPAEMREDLDGMPKAVSGFLQALYNASNIVSGLDSLIRKKAEEAGAGDAGLEGRALAAHLTHQELRDAYQGIMEQQGTISRGFSGIFGGNQKLEPHVMKILSLLEISARQVQKLYLLKGTEENQNGDLGDIRNRMNTTISISHGGNNYDMTPSMYEAYLQVYKTPEKALAGFRRFAELSANDDRTGEEEKEFEKLESLNHTAESYVSAHEYMLQKDRFSQQDMDYIFALKSQEKRGLKGREARQFGSGKSAAAIYQSIALEQIFGGMKEAYRKDAEKKDLKNMAVFQEWLGEYLTLRAYEHADLLEMMLRGLSRVSEKHTRESVLKYFNQMFINGYLSEAVPEPSEEYKGIFLFGPSAYTNIMKKQNSGFPLLLKTLIDKVLKEKRA